MSEAVKIVICADTHLNAYYAKMRPEQLEKRREYLRNAFKQIVDFAIEEKADIFLHAGDIFDMPDPRYSELIFVLNEFMRLKSAGIKSFLIGGTHDIPKARYEAGGAPCIYLLDVIGAVKVFKPQYSVETEVIDVKGKRITIAGVSCDPRVRDGNPLEKLQFPSINSDFGIFMFHYAIEGRMPPNYEGAVVSLHTLRAIPFDLVIAGHLHPHFHFDLGNKLVIIPGATERIDFGEEKNETGFYLLEIAEKPRISYKKISAQPMQNLEIHCEEFKHRPKDERLNYIISRIKSVSHPEKLLKCKLMGEIENDILREIPFVHIYREGSTMNFFFDFDWQGLRLKRAGYVGRDNGPTSVEEELKSVAESLEEDRELIKSALDLALSKWREVR
ncbi:MAG: metallophosphoesterase family protein [bacterium]